jgi:excisionase family DNA binding protein
MQRLGEQEVLLTPAEVAKLFRVDPKTVTRWAKAGKLTAIRTLGGHRRYRKSEVQALLGIDHSLKTKQMIQRQGFVKHLKRKSREELLKEIMPLEILKFMAIKLEVEREKCLGVSQVQHRLLCAIW